MSADWRVGLMAGPRVVKMDVEMADYLGGQLVVRMAAWLVEKLACCLGP